MPDIETVRVTTVGCVVCGKDGFVVMPKNAFVRWSEDGGFIQDVWPEGTAEEREQLISGTHPECFKKLTQGMT